MPEPLKLAELKLRMQAYGIRPKKKFGQNILCDFNLLKAIVADAEIDEGDCVLEIGTGAGSLTGYLCDAAGLVISVEVDPGMFELSRDVLAGVGNLVQVHVDALNQQGRGLNDELVASLAEYMRTGELPLLDYGSPTGLSGPPDKFKVHSHLSGRPPRCGRLKLVANLPYSVATAVLIAALESGLPFERMLVMVQYDVAEKLAAEPGTQHWGLPSLLRWCFADALIKRRVPAKVFWPKPKVESALLELTPQRVRPLFAGENPLQAYHKLRRLAHVLFQHRRKAASNSLALALHEPNTRTSAWIQACGGDPSFRPEQLTPEVLLKLAGHAEVEPLVRKAMQLHEDQLAEKAAKLARRAEWKQRVYGEEE
jgi:16S rRNA (adenine1518-N6/adenine1519-N6)-dimethyltransferase